MPDIKTRKLLTTHLRRDKEHLDLLCCELERQCGNPDYYLGSYDEKQQEHIFKALFKIASVPYDTLDPEAQSMAFLKEGLETYRNANSLKVHNSNPDIKDVDSAWKAVIFTDAAKLCKIIREIENNLLDGKIYKPPVPKTRPLKRPS